MATFEINGDTHSPRTVEAEKYAIADGYFHFSTEEKGRVLSVAAAQVIWVERIKD